MNLSNLKISRHLLVLICFLSASLIASGSLACLLAVRFSQAVPKAFKNRRAAVSSHAVKN